jgi:hypothetical protein
MKLKVVTAPCRVAFVYQRFKGIYLLPPYPADKWWPSRHGGGGGGG